MSLIKIANELESFSDRLQSTLNDRLARVQRSLLSASIAGRSIFSTSAINQIHNLIRKYKVDGTFDPRVQENFQQGQSGNRLFFSADNLMENEDYFSVLTTSDIVKVNLQGTYLKGLLGSNEPILPMAFNIALPLTAEFVGAGSPAEPLYLFVNPTTWNRSAAKVLGKQVVRKGIKVERWGKELEQITAEGSLAGFFTQETGLTKFFVRQTPSFRNLMQLVQVYRNNGCIWGTTYTGNDIAPPSNNRIIDVGFVEILYGYELFRGTFESFTITEDSNKPFSLNYNFVFNVSEVISIYDIIQQSSEFSQYSDQVTLTPGQQLNNLNAITGEVTAFSQSLEYQKLVNETIMNGKNLDSVNTNAVPLIKL